MILSFLLKASAPMTPDSTCMSNENNFWAKGTPFRVVIGLTCFLSVVGSLLIIVSYAFFKNLRNRSRLILVHLSVADLGVGLTNLLGNLIYFDRFYFTTVTRKLNITASLSQLSNVPDKGSLTYDYDDDSDKFDSYMECELFHQPNSTGISGLCEAQAFIAHYFTQVSILWTISLAVFLYFHIVHNTTQLAKYSLMVSYIICYSLPLVVCVWLLLTERFGYSPANTGWCSILIINAKSNLPDVYAAVLGYDVWIYLGMTLVPILYLAVQLYVREKLSQTKLYLPQAEGRFWEAVYILDYKFLLIPIVFTLLRMWTCIVILLFVYVQWREVPLWLNIAFVYLAGVGDSAQGAANAILFVLFTKRVRRTLFSVSYWRYKLSLYWANKTSVRDEYKPLLEESAILKQSAGSYPNSEIFTPSGLSDSLPNVFKLPSNTN